MLGSVQIFRSPIHDLSRNSVILDFRVPVGEAPSLTLTIFSRDRHRLGSI